MNYARAVLSRPYIFTIAFLVVNLFIFMLMWSSSSFSTSSLLGSFGEDVLLTFGAKENYWIQHEHQYWRFVTPVFIHVNLFHILINMYSLWIIGPWVEKLYGSAKFVVFWVVTGIAGVVASYLTFFPGARPGVLGSFLIKTADSPSAGASGALFGMIGVLFVFGIKYRRELPEGFKRAFGTGMVPVIALNLVIGFAGRSFIDNAAHLGGLASGAAIAAFVGYKRPGTSAGVAIAWRVLQVASLLLIVICFVMAIRAAQSNPVVRLRTAFDESHRAFAAGDAAVVDAIMKGDASHAGDAIAQLDKAAHFNDEADALRTDLKALIDRAVKFANEWRQPRQLTPEAKAERQKLVTDFKQWQKRYGNWLRAGGVDVAEPTPEK